MSLLVGDDEWTTVTLQRASIEGIRLGCHSLNSIVSKLLDFLVLRKEYEYTSTYLKTPCRAIIVLLEPHAILFAHRQDDRHQFFVVEQYGKCIADFTLNDDQASIWEETLRKWTLQINEK